MHNWKTSHIHFSTHSKFASHIFHIFVPMCIWILYIYFFISIYTKLICEWMWPQFFANPPRSSFYEPHHIYIHTIQHMKIAWMEGWKWKQNCVRAKLAVWAFFPPSSSGIIYTHHIQNITNERQKQQRKKWYRKRNIEASRVEAFFCMPLFLIIFHSKSFSYGSEREGEKISRNMYYMYVHIFTVYCM